jgi:hypothetical protein
MYFPNYQAIPPQYQQPQQIGGLIPVRSVQEAQNYPVAHGNSVTFKDENSPYLYVKTMGFSQMDRPTFEVYRLVKEEAQEAAPSDFDKVKADISRLQSEVDKLKDLIGGEADG